jgi:hypothetical protein
MSGNGKAIVDGVTHLATAYAGGDTAGVNVVLSEEGGNVIHVYLVDELQKVFTDADVAFMESLGFFHTSFDEDAYAENPYSHFWLPV